MITLAIANQKGGTGKTTTAATLGAILATENRRVLLVDLDPQSSLTQGLGIDAAGASLAEVIGGAVRGHMAMSEIIRPISSGLDLAPSDLALAAAELGLSQRIGRESVLTKALALLTGYDLAIIDCPPSLGLLTLNGLTASAGVIVPSLPSAADLRGVRLFLGTLETMQAEGLNPDLQLLGVILTQFDGRTLAHNQALDVLRAGGLQVIGIIPRGVKVQEAGAAMQTLIDYDPQGKPTAAYYQAAESVMKWLNKNRT